MTVVTGWLLTCTLLCLAQRDRLYAGVRTTPTLWTNAADFGRPATTGPFFDRIVALDGQAVRQEADWWQATESAFRERRPLTVTVAQPDGQMRTERLSV
jgi:hypothetical protein